MGNVIQLPGQPSRKKSKPPKKIIIGSRTFTIRITSEQEDNQLVGLHGYTRCDYDQIVIDRHRSEDSIRHTVLHEVLHAIRLVHGNDYEDSVYVAKKKLGPLDAEHYFIDLYTEGLIGVLQNNPDFAAYLMKK